MIGISLNHDISCENICRSIQKLVENYRKENSLENAVLTIQINVATEGVVQDRPICIENH